MRALVKWTVFCLVTGRRPGIDLATRGTSTWAIARI